MTTNIFIKFTWGLWGDNQKRTVIFRAGNSNCRGVFYLLFFIYMNTANHFIYLFIYFYFRYTKYSCGNQAVLGLKRTPAQVDPSDMRYRLAVKASASYG